jgi:hypothetical protein
MVLDGEAAAIIAVQLLLMWERVAETRSVEAR